MIPLSSERRSQPRRERRAGERRGPDRRCVNLIVPAQRRCGTDRRNSQRRRETDVPALPIAWGTAPSRAILRDAMHRVAAGWSAAGGDALSHTEVRELLGAMERALLLGEAPANRMHSPLGRRLLELVRAELVRYAAAAPATLRADAMWRLMEDIEELRGEIEPRWDPYFASRLAGRDGLELVVDVVHDLRSPLTSVLFLAELLAHGQSGPVNDLQRRQLGLIYSAALGLTELAGNVMELARGGNRLTDGEPSPFSVADVLCSVRDIVRPLAEEKNIEIRLVPPHSDHRLGHAVALSRILLNLTTNALKFTPEGYVEIAVRETAVSRLQFNVRDTGPGIRHGAVETLYSPFRQAPNGHGYVLSGTGLGLSLCRKLVVTLGGTLQVETDQDSGTRFYFELNLPTVDAL